MKVIARVPLLLTILLLDGSEAGAGARLLRRQPTISTGKRKTQEIPPCSMNSTAVPTLISSNSSELDALADEEVQAFLAGWTVDASLTSFSMPSSSCYTAYVFCGPQASICSLEGGWELDVSAMHLEQDLTVQCELRLGAGRCDNNSIVPIEVPPADADTIIGAFEIAAGLFRTQLFDSALGMIDDLQLVFPDGEPARRLAHTGGASDPLAFSSNLYGDLMWNLEAFDILPGGGFSSQHIAIYVNVCERQNDGTGSTLSFTPSTVPAIGTEGDASSPSMAPSDSSSPTVPSLAVPTTTASQAESIPKEAATLSSSAPSGVDSTMILIALAVGSLFGVLVFGNDAF